jgi:hypothetical protein
MLVMTTGDYCWIKPEATTENFRYASIARAWADTNDQSRAPDDNVQPPVIPLLHQYFGYDKDLAFLVTAMLNPNPVERLNIEEIISSPWFLQQSCCVVYDIPPHQFSNAAPHQHILQHHGEQEQQPGNVRCILEEMARAIVKTKQARTGSARSVGSKKNVQTPCRRFKKTVKSVFNKHGRKSKNGSNESL